MTFNNVVVLSCHGNKVLLNIFLYLFTGKKVANEEAQVGRLGFYSRSGNNSGDIYVEMNLINKVPASRVD